jgi:hypothetical protein
MIPGLRMQAEAAQDPDGFLHTDRCDSLLFSGLLAHTSPVSGVEVNLAAARDEEEDGKWWRRPISYQECWESGESRSTISRDMLLGVMWATMPMSDSEALDILLPLYEYGKAHLWVMGEGRYGGIDTVMPPAYIALLSDLLVARGHAPGDVLAWAAYPNNVDGDCSAYVCHVNVLRHLLRVRAGWSQPDYPNLAKIANRYPQNALFQYAAGRRYAAATLLLKQYRDTTALPFCEEWPMQENGGVSNWARCENGKDTGAGALFVLSLLLDK